MTLQTQGERNAAVNVMLDKVKHEKLRIERRRVDDERRLVQTLESMTNRANAAWADYRDRGVLTDVTLHEIRRETIEADELVGKIRNAYQQVAQLEWLVDAERPART